MRTIFSSFICLHLGLLWVSILHLGFLQLPWAGTALCRCAQVCHCRGFSYCRVSALEARASVLAACGSVVSAPQLLSADSIVVAQGLGFSAACGVFLDQGWNPCLLHCQEDLPLSHLGSPVLSFINLIYFLSGLLLWVSLMLYCVSEVHSLLLLNDIPFGDIPQFVCLFICSWTFRLFLFGG